MGRQNWKDQDRVKKGPGRKSRKQGDPTLPLKLQEEDRLVRKVKKSGNVGGRIKQRGRKRALKEAMTRKLKKSKPKGSKVPPPSELQLVPKEKEPLRKELFEGGSDGGSGQFL